jgi:hypothetical protein
MKKFLFLTLSLIQLLVLSACDSDANEEYIEGKWAPAKWVCNTTDEENSSFSFDVPAEGANYTFTWENDFGFIISSISENDNFDSWYTHTDLQNFSDDWCSVAIADYDATINIKPNDSTDDRKIIIYIELGDFFLPIYINQAGK